jgi:CBS domain containing-hemolysin-like protein
MPDLMNSDSPKTLTENSKLAEPPPAEVSRDDEVEDGPSGGLLAKLFGFWARAASNEDLAEAIENAANTAANSSLPRARREMIERVIAFDEKRVDDVMAPRADIVAVDVDTSLGDLVKAFAEGGHSRMPIYRGDLDNPLGMVHVKDIVTLIAKPQSDPPPGSSTLKQIKRDVLYVPQSMRIMDLLVRMQASRIHMALVIDEYGGTDGLVTIEDLVEEIVGDINDEHDDEAAPTIVPRLGGWDADARVELAELAEVIGEALSVDEGEAVDTLGGLVFSIAGRVPQRGEVLSHPAGYDFEVIDADARKIRKIRIRKAPPKEPAPEAEL